MQPIFTARQRAAQRALVERTTQTTGAIQSVRLTNTGPLSPSPEPPRTTTIHIGGILPSLVDITPVCLGIILTGFRMAFVQRRIQLHDATYLIVAIYQDPNHVGRIMACLERVEENA